MSEYPQIVAVIKEWAVECGHRGCCQQYGTCEIPKCRFTAYSQCLVKMRADVAPALMNLCDEHVKDPKKDVSAMKVMLTPFD